MKYESLNRDKMSQKELRSICAELHTAINWGVEIIKIQMTDDKKVNLINLDEHLQYYQQGVETISGSINNVGTKLNLKKS
jgi:hypothetical protein